MTTKAITRVSRRQPPAKTGLSENQRQAIEFFVAIGKTSDLKFDFNMVRALAEEVKRLLRRPAIPEDIALVLKRFGKSVKWAGADTEPDPQTRLEAMHDSMQRNAFPLFVIITAMNTLVDEAKWFPSTAELVENCRAVIEEIEAGIQKIDQHFAAIEAAEEAEEARAEREERQLQEQIREELLQVEEEVDPQAIIRREFLERARQRVARRQREVNEAEARVREAKRKVAGLRAGFVYRRLDDDGSEMAFEGFSPAVREGLLRRSELAVKVAETALAERQEALIEAQKILAEEERGYAAAQIPRAENGKPHD